MSEVRRRERAVFSVSIPLLLLLVFVQMLTSHVFLAGEFILSDRASVSPFGLRLTGGRGSPVNEDGAEVNINVYLGGVAILCLYSPVVLVAFALLAVVLAAYGRDRDALRLSAACQAASGLLLLAGIGVFLCINAEYVSWDHMTPGFYFCLPLPLELFITAALTRESGRRLTSD